MSDIASILKHLPTLQAAEQIAILELQETRLAAVVLRPSPIWTYAIVGSPMQEPQWAQQWRQLIDKATLADITDLRHYGQAPGGRNLSEALATAVKQLLPRPPNHILPIGKLAEGEYVAEMLADRFPGARVLASQPTLSLPAAVTREALYTAIAQKHPPKVPADYYLKTAALDSKGQKLTFKNERIFKQGEPPPSGMTQFIEKRLYRAIAQPPNPTPLQIELLNEQMSEPIFRRTVNPPRNVFTLKAGFNYLTDALFCDLFDEQGNRLADAPQENPPPADLPAVHARTTVDIAFILDGALRKKQQVFEQGVPVERWKPDLSEARRFLVNILDRLSASTATDAQVALCLYGDFQNSRDVKYLYQPLPFQPPDELRDHIQRPGSKVMETEDLDYEAALERALRWANPHFKELHWRDKSLKFLVVIGYAPPHPPRPVDGGPFVYPEETMLIHEPFTSHINWRQELTQIRYNKIQVVPIWVPPAELSRDHRCMRYSYEVWYQLGEKQKYRPLEGLQADAEEELWAKLTAGIADQLLVHEPLYWPLATQIHNLRVSTA
jgi:hypothetical protein